MAYNFIPGELYWILADRWSCVKFIKSDFGNPGFEYIGKEDTIYVYQGAIKEVIHIERPKEKDPEITELDNAEFVAFFDNKVVPCQTAIEAVRLWGGKGDITIKPKEKLATPHKHHFDFYIARKHLFPREDDCPVLRCIVHGCDLRITGNDAIAAYVNQFLENQKDEP
jgi:hypothetical protein